jgi:AcrR family transcriptional regulator
MRQRKPRDRIVAAATRLFTDQGILTVGIDAIAAEAGVAVATIYRQFGGKDQLVAAALQRWSADWLRWLSAEVARAGQHPADGLTALWDAFDGWFAGERFRGSLIANAAVELRGRPAHPAHAVISAHRTAMGRLLEDVAARAGARDPGRAAERLQVLADGATAMAATGHRPELDPGFRALAGAAIAAATQ